MGRKPPWPSGRCCWTSCWLGRLAQNLSSTTWFCSSTQRCISGFWQPERMESAAAARRGAATWEERRIGERVLQRIRARGHGHAFAYDFAHAEMYDFLVDGNVPTDAGGARKINKSCARIQNENR